MNNVLAIAIAIVALVASVSIPLVSLLVSTRRARRSNFSSLMHAMVSAADAINSRGSQSANGVRSPYAYLLDVPDEQREAYEAWALSFMQHVNLLSLLWENRADIPGILPRLENWLAKIVLPWIEASEPGHEYIRQTWYLLATTNDMEDPCFINWLKRHLPEVPPDWSPPKKNYQREPKESALH